MRTRHLTNRLPFHLIIVLGTMGCLALGGCLGRTPPALYFSLQSLTTPAVEARLPSDVGIVIGPVDLPAAIDRPQIITRDGDSNIQISEFNRWIGPLQEDIAAILAKDISDALKSDRIIPYTRENLLQPDYRVIISIDRLEGKLADTLVLDAAWSIKNARQQAPLVMRRSSFREPLNTTSYADLVRAHSKVLAELGKEIAETLVETVGDR